MTCHQIMQSDYCDINCFAGTIQVINGGLECGGNVAKVKTENRINNYVNIGKKLEIPEFLENHQLIRHCISKTCEIKDLRKCGKIRIEDSDNNPVVNNQESIPDIESKNDDLGINSEVNENNVEDIVLPDIKPGKICNSIRNKYEFVKEDIDADIV